MPDCFRAFFFATIVSLSVPALEAGSLRVEPAIQGGGIGGFGFLGVYGEGGPRRFRLFRRMRSSGAVDSRTASVRAFESISSVRVLNPAGELVTFLDLSDRANTSWDVSVPHGGAGIWRVSVMTALPGEGFDLEFPETPDWGVRGEMALASVSGLPLRPWLYVPPRTAFARILTYRGKNVLRRELGTRPPNGVLCVEIPTGAGLSFAFDGVPGLLCPTERAARRLKGGTDEVGGVTVFGPLQACARRAMLAYRGRDLTVRLEFPKIVPTDLKDPMREALFYGKYAPLSGLDAALAVQCLDFDSSALGSQLDVRKGDYTDWSTGAYWVLGGIQATLGLANTWTIPGRMNPAFENEALKMRTVLSALYHVNRMQGDDLVRENALESHPIVHFFFLYESLAKAYEAIRGKISPSEAAILREGVMAMGDKAAVYRGYVSNQWSHMIIGHLALYQATGERRFLDYFERAARVFLECGYGPGSKFGQHPAGYYIEGWGSPDGNYDHLNSYSIVSAYYRYRALPEAKQGLVALFRKAIERNLLFKSYHLVAQPDGRFFYATAPNGRTDGSLVSPSYPGDVLAAHEFPVAAAAHFARRPPEDPRKDPANIMPHFINSDDWARRFLARKIAEGASDVPDVTTFLGEWTGELFHWFSLGYSVEPSVLPADGPDGTWMLPGQIAWKRGGIYGLVFYDNAGADERMASGLTSGGPLQLRTNALGTFVASMREAKGDRSHPFVWSGVSARRANGALWRSGKEFGALEGDPSGGSFWVSSRPHGLGNGALVWSYAVRDEGLTIGVRFRADGVRDALLHLPVRTEYATKTVLRDGCLRLENDRGWVSIDVLPCDEGISFATEEIVAACGKVRPLFVQFPSSGEIRLVIRNGECR